MTVTLPDTLLAGADGDGARLIRDAHALAVAAHEGQWRDGGAPYVTHPVAVAQILASHRQPAEVIAAALLHDVVEDTPVEIGEIGARFGAEVARLVDGVTKLETIYFPDKHGAELANYRRLLEAVRRDPRVLLVKVADRLHNLRTLGAVSPRRRRGTCRATLSVYAPLAYRLSAHRFYRELEDEAAGWLWPRQMATLRAQAASLRAVRNPRLEELCALITDTLALEARLRPKHDASLLAKTVARGVSLRQVSDLDAVEVIAALEQEIRPALVGLERLIGPARSVTDYLARPRANGYRALHATFELTSGPVSVHLLTPRLREQAEFGVGAVAFPEQALEFLRRASGARGDRLLESISSEVHDDTHPTGPSSDRARLSAWNAALAHSS